jgi:2-deoxy-D-gluconate 3-dehydrogenase
MKKGKGGKIVNIGSLYSIFGSPGMPAYAASKGGVIQLTKSLAIAWADENIRVNAIVPGYINTELSAVAKSIRPELEEMVISRTPSGRWGEPEDIAGAAVFLSSPASDFITGIALPVDGGYSVMP